MSSKPLTIDKTLVLYQCLLLQRRRLRQERAALRKQRREKFTQFCQEYLHQSAEKDTATLNEKASNNEQ